MRIKNKTKAQIDHDYWFRKKAKRPTIVIHDLPNEEWRDVIGYEGLYLVSNMGRVRGVKRTKLSNGHIYEWAEKIRSTSGKKYKSVTLFKNGTRKYLLVHRLVAEAFIPNPDNKPEVNHKNGIKADNRASELEWHTRLENTIHAIETGLRNNIGDNHPLSKRIGMYDMNGNLVEEFGFITGAMKKYGFKTMQLIINAARGSRESAYNHKWKYL